MSRRSLHIDIETAMNIIEDILERRGVKFRTKRFYTRYGLRKVEYRLGFLKRIRIINYEWGVEVVIPRSLKELDSLLSAYEFRIPKVKDKWDVLELQIYEKKLEMAKGAIKVRTSTLATLCLVSVFVEAFCPGLGWWMFDLALLLLPISLIVPAMRGGYEFVEPTEWAIPLLYPYYKAKIRRLKETY